MHNFNIQYTRLTNKRTARTDTDFIGPFICKQLSRIYADKPTSRNIIKATKSPTPKAIFNYVVSITQCLPFTERYNQS